MMVVLVECGIDGGSGGNGGVSGEVVGRWSRAGEGTSFGAECTQAEAAQAAASGLGAEGEADNTAR